MVPVLKLRGENIGRSKYAKRIVNFYNLPEETRVDFYA